MSRGLDHIVHAVRDLDAAAAFYRRLGFTVGARNTHPWGTHNHIVQLPGFFVELLTVAEPEKLGDEGFAALFGGFNQAFLKSHEGLSCLMLESQDAAADCARFRHRRHRRLAGAAVRARGHGGPTAARIKVGFCARLRARRPRSADRLCNLPAASPGELLEPGSPASRERDLRRRRGRDRGRESERPSHLPVRFHRRARAQIHLERDHGAHAARRCSPSWMGRRFAAISACRRLTLPEARGSRRFGSRCATAMRSSRRSRPARSRTFCIWAMSWWRRRPQWERHWCSRRRSD